MARINSYTGEVVSEAVEFREQDGDFVLRVEDAVLESTGLDPAEPIVVKGTVGGESLTIEAAEDP